MSSSWSKLLIPELDLTLQTTSSQTGPDFPYNFPFKYSKSIFIRNVQVSATYVTTGLINVRETEVLGEILPPLPLCPP
jgi:hypothetical protein